MAVAAVLLQIMRKNQLSLVFPLEPAQASDAFFIAQTVVQDGGRPGRRAVIEAAGAGVVRKQVVPVFRLQQQHRNRRRVSGHQEQPDAWEQLDVLLKQVIGNPARGDDAAPIGGGGLPLLVIGQCGEAGIRKILSGYIHVLRCFGTLEKLDAARVVIMHMGQNNTGNIRKLDAVPG